MNPKDRRLGIGAGRESNMVKPTGYYHLVPPDQAYHIDCGGQIIHNTGEYVVYEWECQRCHQKWESKTLRGMSVEELGDRFYFFPKPDGDTYVIVEDTDGHKTFTRTVTQAEADQRKLKRIPDPTK